MWFRSHSFAPVVATVLGLLVIGIFGGWLALSDQAAVAVTGCVIILVGGMAIVGVLEALTDRASSVRSEPQTKSEVESVSIELPPSVRTLARRPRPRL